MIEQDSESLGAIERRVQTSVQLAVIESRLASIERTQRNIMKAIALLFVLTLGAHGVEHINVNEVVKSIVGP